MSKLEDGAKRDFPQWLVAYTDDHAEGKIGYGLSFRVQKEWAQSDYFSRDYGEPSACLPIPEPEDPALKMILAGLFKLENDSDKWPPGPLQNWITSLAPLFVQPAIERERYNRAHDAPKVEVEKT